MLTLTEVFFSAQLSVLAYVVTCVLTAQGYLLESWYDMLVDMEQGTSLGKWLSKPLGLCEKCAAGQLSLWVWLYFNYSDYAVDIPEALLRHGLFIAFTILTVSLIKSTLNKWN